MKVRITHTLQRTIDIEVDEVNEQGAIDAALAIAYEIQPADWEYTWVPTAQEGHVIAE